MIYSIVIRSYFSSEKENSVAVETRRLLIVFFPSCSENLVEKEYINAELHLPIFLRYIEDVCMSEEYRIFCLCFQQG